MSTENEGTAVPPAPSAPPVPVDTPAASVPPEQAVSPGAGPAGPAGPHEGTNQPHGPGSFQGDAPTATLPPTPPGAPQGANPAPEAGAWPPPPPPSATPAYANAAGSGPYAGGGEGGSGPYGGAGAGGSGPYGGGGEGGSGPYGGGAESSSGDVWGSSYQQPAPKPKSGGRGGLVAAVLVAALIAGGVGGGIGYWAADRNDDSSGSTTVSSSESGGDLKRDAGTVANVAATALPSTVTIEAEGSNGEGGTGTGFVFDKQGHILTNNHVVAEAVESGKLSATFSNGKKYDAEVVGHAQGYDVAVIKLKNAPDNLKPLPLGNSDKIAVGDSTIAIGAPFGLSNTVTTGIISAKNRPVASSDGSSSSKASYMSALQTDASINPGNSGGPLLDAKGAVIGINSAIQSTSGGLGGTSQSGSIGLGFAIPINQAKNVAQQLIKTGKPVYPVIGASVSLEEGTGAKITEQGAGNSDAVTPNGPAAKAGLKPGDVITKLDDRVIDSGPTLIGEIWTHQPGDTVKLTYTRDGKQRTAEVTLGQREGDS
ncbi:trypsin-like peptidase domain-containing protein [Streptomyces sp. LRE541]|uniref:S1C family serine protease n=1 Tax=Streptomyces sp. LRE541 TaxID=2931983 RepID=UPI0020106B1B|nr:trypsin-like peptidase domain-containing protein [Streptomyces sp. LRE541]UPZ30049.1 trypsin-like peptidase domain-containing protein [Streptomyces sp. LRE541]